MLRKLLFTNFDQEDLPEKLWHRAERLTAELIRLDRNATTYALHASTSDGIILRLGMSADAEFQDACPTLKYLGMYGTGYGRIDTEHARARGIAVTNVAGYSTEAVAELVVAIAISELRNLSCEHARAAEGDVSETSFRGRTLRNATIGIVGMGNIGAYLTKMLTQGFDSPVLYWSRHRRRTLESTLIKFADLDELVSQSDIISVHLAANSSTENLFGQRRIAQIKKGAILINTAPNELVDLQAVMERCRQGSLRYVTDHADELQLEAYSQLRAIPNIIVYPPIGYATADTLEKKHEILISNIESYVAGNLENRVD